MHVWKGCGGGTILFTLLRGLFDALFLEARLVVAIFYSFWIAVQWETLQDILWRRGAGVRRDSTSPLPITI